MSSLLAIAELITHYAGLQLGERDLPLLHRVVQQRLSALRLSCLNQYRSLLAITAPNQGDWPQLLAQITVGESYFFRDQKQLTLLRQRLLPDCLQHQSDHAKHLRIWSAGCAAGEEPYSLAMVLWDLGLVGNGWTVEVVGTDISQEALAKARNGVYTDWAFRQTPVEVRSRYFLAERPNRWRVRPEIQALVTFAEFNLAQDDLQLMPWAEAGFDIILCRNVFIYFTQAAIARSLNTFVQGLRPGAYLMTGHAELQGINTQPLRTLCFPESVIYQQPRQQAKQQAKQQVKQQAKQQARVKSAVETAIAASHRIARPPSSAWPASPPASLSPIAGGSGQPQQATATLPEPRQNIAALVDSAAPSPMAVSAPTSDRSSQMPYQATLAAAHQLANQGQYEAARRMCEQAAAAWPLEPDAYSLLAMIAETTGDLEGAKVFLKRVIYLDPQAIAAYWELAALYEQTGDATRAAKARATTRSLLADLPDHQPLKTWDGLTVAEVREHLSGH